MQEFAKEALSVLYQDDRLVVIHKPHGLLVHRSKYADEAKVFAVQELRNQIGQHVWPCHRLDRKTSGILVFALDTETNAKVQQQFENNQVQKTYWAIVRGFTPDEGTIDYALTNDKGKEQDALTDYKTLQSVELDLAFGKFQTSRYSLVELYPKTGRLHQLRKHMAHIFHPIIGDRPHGCNKQNRLFKEKWQMTTMMLHAKELKMQHPYTGEQLHFQAPLSDSFMHTMHLLGFKVPQG